MRRDAGCRRNDPIVRRSNADLSQSYAFYRPASMLSRKSLTVLTAPVLAAM
jgi:hypothetical protein